jgi:KDO2-lipid IV(A) lauroyltransferase
MAAPALSFSRKLRHGAEAAIFSAFMALFRVIGLDAASALGSLIGRHVFSRLPPARIAKDNLAAAFPEKNDTERGAILTAMWDNLGRVVAEYAHLDKFDIAGPDPRIRALNLGDTDAAFARGRGVIFLAAHLANWEVMPITGELLGFDAASMVRPPNNPYIARWVERQRARRGPRDQIGKHNAMRRMFAQLRGGKALYIMVDQKLDEGIAAPFFGRPAMTTHAPAALALKLGAEIFFVSNRRVGGSHFEVVIRPSLAFAPSGDETSDIRALTEAITARVEEMIRADPAQWLWIHRRWPK